MDERVCFEYDNNWFEANVVDDDKGKVFIYEIRIQNRSDKTWGENFANYLDSEVEKEMLEIAMKKVEVDQDKGAII